MLGEKPEKEYVSMDKKMVGDMSKFRIQFSNDREDEKEDVRPCCKSVVNVLDRSPTRHGTRTQSKERIRTFTQKRSIQNAVAKSIPARGNSMCVEYTGGRNLNTAEFSG